MFPWPTRVHTSWYVCRPSGAGCGVWADSRGFTPVSGPVPLRGTFSWEVPTLCNTHTEPRAQVLWSHWDYPAEGMKIVFEMSNLQEPLRKRLGRKIKFKDDGNGMWVPSQAL